MTGEYNETTRGLVDTLIQGDVNHIRDVYHLARTGVPVEYEGYTGRALAFQAAIDLHNLGISEGTDYLQQISDERYAEFLAEPGNLSNSLSGIDAAKTMHLYVPHPGTHEKIAVAYDWTVANGVYDFNFQDWDDIDPVEHAAAIIADLMINTGVFLHTKGFEDMEGDIVRGLEKYTECAQRAVVLNPVLAPKYYHKLQKQCSRLRGYVSAESSEYIDTQLVKFYEQAARLSYEKDSSIRAVALNAAADLRDLYPDNKKYRRQARRLAHDVNLQLMRSKFEDMTSEEHEALERISRGTIFDFRAWLHWHYLSESIEDTASPVTSRFR